MLIIDLVLLVAGALGGFAGARAVRARRHRSSELGGLRRLSPPAHVGGGTRRPPPPVSGVAPHSPAPVAPFPAPRSPAPTQVAAPGGATRRMPPRGPAGAASLERETPPGRSVVLAARPFTIGRRPDRDLVLDDDRVSREHATLFPVESGWALRDDGSSNGSRLNGHRVAARAEVPLRDGDRLTFGDITFVFRLTAAPHGGPDATRMMPGGPR